MFTCKEWEGSGGDNHEAGHGGIGDGGHGGDGGGEDGDDVGGFANVFQRSVTTQQYYGDSEKFPKGIDQRLITGKKELFGERAAREFCSAHASKVRPRQEFAKPSLCSTFSFPPALKNVARVISHFSILCPPLLNVL